MRRSVHLLLIACLLVLATFAGLPAQQAQAATLTVTKTDDTNDGACNADCSLREAIAVAASGDTIVFDPALAGQTITLTIGPLTINRSVTIDGSGLASRVRVSGNNQRNIFIVNGSNLSVSFTALEIINGYAAQTGYGGGIYINASTTVVNLDSVTMSGNRSTGAGGAVWIYGGAVTMNVQNSTFTSNGTGSYHDGGAIYNYSQTLNLTNSTFASNGGTAGYGGAIFNYGGGTARVTNSTFTGNTNGSGFPGAAIANYNSIIYITNFTIAGNSGTVGAFYNTGNAFVYNSIFANTTGPYDCVGNIFAANLGNLIETRSGCSAPVTAADPVLDPLADNGGPTQTMALQPGSPAINTGDNPNCPATDQRGVTRPQGGTCDIGAFEAVTATSLTVTKTDDTNDGACDADCSLREAVSAAAANDTIVFAADLSGQTIRLGSTLVLPRNVTIDGSSLAVPVAISGDTNADGTGDVRVFQVPGGVTAIFQSLAITGGYSGASASGGGVLSNGALYVYNSAFSDNRATVGGGAIASYGALTVRNSTFTNNNGAFGGGAIYPNGSVTVSISNSTFVGNTADAGGAIHSNASNLTITNCTFANNTAVNHGAVDIRTGNGNVRFSTFANNSATGLGSTIGVQNAQGGVLTISNSILSAPGVNNCDGSINNGGNNLQFPAGSNCPAAITANPLLGPLANNRGPTQTLALLPGSPAINNANNSVCTAIPVNGVDQRGVARPQLGNCDIGAFEVDRTPPSVVITSPAPNPTNTSPIPVTITFSESVSGFAVGDLVVGNGTAGDFSGSGAVYTALITPSADGLVTVNVPAGVAASAGGGNSAANQFSITYDGTAPGVTVTSSASSPTNTSPIPVTITFSETVTGFELADLTVGNGTAGSFSGSGEAYTAVITPTADGAVTVDIAADVAEDAAGNGNTAAEPFSITYDGTAPGVTVTSSASSPTNTSPIPVTITFSETVTGFELADLTVGNGTAGSFSGSGAIYTAAITPTADGPVTVDIAAGVAVDATGNANSAAARFSSVYDSTAPTAALDPLPGKPPKTFTVSWSGSDALSGVASYDVQVQQNGGAWMPWQTDTAATSAQFTADYGILYGFRVRAVDGAGNIGAWSPTVETRVYLFIYLPIIFGTP